MFVSFLCERNEVLFYLMLLELLLIYILESFECVVVFKYFEMFYNVYYFRDLYLMIMGKWKKIEVKGEMYILVLVIDVFYGFLLYV